MNTLIILYVVLLCSQKRSYDNFKISNMGTNGMTSFRASKPRVAYGKAEDKYLVVWAADDNRGHVVDEEFEIYGQFIDGNGNEVGLNDFRISFLATDGDPAFKAEDPDIVYNSMDNEFLVVWRGETSIGGENEIFGQRIDANTGILLGSNFRISDMGTEGDINTGAFLPKVEYSSISNEYLVVWEGDDTIHNKMEIYGQKISNLGIEIGDNDFKISNQLPVNDTSYDARYPNLIWNGTDNDFLVVWVGETTADNEFEVYGQLFDFDTNAFIGSDFKISDMGVDGDTSSVVGQSLGVAYNKEDNEYLVVWYGADHASNAFEVYGQRLLPNGVEIGANDFRISYLTDENPSFDAWTPEVVWNQGNNEYFVVFRGNANIVNEEDVYGQKLSCTGELIGSYFMLSGMGSGNDVNHGADYPCIATNHQNGYLITWQGDDNTASNDEEMEIYLQMYDNAIFRTRKSNFGNIVLFLKSWDYS